MASANDMKAAEKTYSSFISNIKWIIPVVALVTAIVVIAIAP